MGPNPVNPLGACVGGIGHFLVIPRVRWVGELSIQQGAPHRAGQKPTPESPSVLSLVKQMNSGSLQKAE